MIMCPESCLYFRIDYLLILSFHHNYKYFLLQILKILKHGSAVTAAHSGLRAFYACRHEKNATHSDLGEMLAWQFLLVAPSGLARQTCSGTLSPLLVAPMNVA